MPADKGKGTVAMDTENYKQKVNSMLSDTKTYERPDKDPMTFDIWQVCLFCHILDELRFTHHSQAFSIVISFYTIVPTHLLHVIWGPVYLLIHEKWAIGIKRGD